MSNLPYIKDSKRKSCLGSNNKFFMPKNSLKLFSEYIRGIKLLKQKIIFSVYVQTLRKIRLLRHLTLTQKIEPIWGKKKKSIYNIIKFNTLPTIWINNYTSLINKYRNNSKCSDK